MHLDMAEPFVETHPMLDNVEVLQEEQNCISESTPSSSRTHEDESMSGTSGTTASSMSLQHNTAAIRDRLSFTSKELKTPLSPSNTFHVDYTPMSPSNTFHVDYTNRFQNDNISSGTYTITSPRSPRSPRSMAVPTPVNFMDIIQPLDEMSTVQKNVKQRKYPVLPSIGKLGEIQQQEQPELLPSRERTFDTSNYNQLDYTREKMENEADFFSDYRINTSIVKMTPRQNPLPPIGQNTSVGGGLNPLSEI